MNGDNKLISLSDSDLNSTIESLCHSKAEEFQMLGYESVVGKDIWECVSSKYRQGVPALYQVVNDILSLKVTHLMNWMTMNAFRGDDLGQGLDITGL